jgi:hypothetical protein
MWFLEKRKNGWYACGYNATGKLGIGYTGGVSIIEEIERLESFNKLKKYVKIYEKYNFSDLETYSWWKNPFMFENSMPTGKELSTCKEREEAGVMKTLFEKLGGKGYAKWNKEFISGSIVALKFYQKLSGCYIELSDFEKAFSEVPEMDSNFIDTLNQFCKDCSEIMNNTEIAKKNKKIQEFINL